MDEMDGRYETSRLKPLIYSWIGIETLLVSCAYL